MPTPVFVVNWQGAGCIGHMRKSRRFAHCRQTLPPLSLLPSLVAHETAHRFLRNTIWRKQRFLTTNTTTKIVAALCSASIELVSPAKLRPMI
jgi:hypothetical protein